MSNRQITTQGHLFQGPFLGEAMIHRAPNVGELMGRRRSVAGVMGELASGFSVVELEPVLELTPELLQMGLYDGFNRPDYTDNTPPLIVPRRKANRPDNLVGGVLFPFDELELFPRFPKGLSRAARVGTHIVNKHENRDEREAKKYRSAAHTLEGYQQPLIKLSVKLHQELQVLQRARDLFENNPNRARFKRGRIRGWLRDAELPIRRALKVAAESNDWDAGQADMALEAELYRGNPEQITQNWQAYLKVVGWHTRDKSHVVWSHSLEVAAEIQEQYRLARTYEAQIPEST